VLALFGGNDETIPESRIDDFAAAIGESGIDHSIHVYPDALHSFFDRSYEQFAQESADAWERVLGFLGQVERSGRRGVRM